MNGYLMEQRMRQAREMDRANGYKSQAQIEQEYLASQGMRFDAETSTGWAVQQQVNRSIYAKALAEGKVNPTTCGYHNVFSYNNASDYAAVELAMRGYY